MDGQIENQVPTSDSMTNAGSIAQGDASQKLFDQSEVDRVAGKVREEAYQRGRREAEMELQRSGQPQSMGGMQQLSEEHVRNLIAQEAQKHMEMQQAQALEASAHRDAKDFFDRLAVGKDKYPDFEKRVGKLPFQNISHIVHMARGLDNVVDVMYELAKNPNKLTTLDILFHRAPELAQEQMQELSDSLKKNSNASSQPFSDEPLSQIKPSNTGTDNGSLTTRDYKKVPWLRG